MTARAMKLLIVGYGKMGRMVEELAASEGVEIVGRVDQGRDEWANADVAVDFSTSDALLSNFAQYAARRLPVVIGTTGWTAHVDRLRAQAQQAGIGVVASAVATVVEPCRTAGGWAAPASGAKAPRSDDAAETPRPTSARRRSASRRVINPSAWSSAISSTR